MVESTETAMTHTALPKIRPWEHPAINDMEFFRMSVEEYEALGEQGVLTPNSKVELIEGHLVPKRMQNEPHSSTLNRIDEDLKKSVPDGWRVRIQLPIRILESVPEPDAVVAKGDRRAFDKYHPVADQIGLVVEVSESTLAYDRSIKMPLYSRAGIPEYWIVNLIDLTVEVYTEPTFENGYAERRDYKADESVPLVLNGETTTSFRVADLLP
jgi:Uma2 family endonuclease